MSHADAGSPTGNGADRAADLVADLAAGPPRKLAVLGSPIAHSKSPQLHAAAHRVLGLPWSYSAVEVIEGSLGAFINTCDSNWRGLSLTMPLKREVLPMLASRSALVETVGAANTVLFDDDLAMHGFNTDVAGIVAAFAGHGVSALDRVQILGGGATAASVLAAVAQLGATQATVLARDPERASALEQLAARLGIELTIRRLGVVDRSLTAPGAVISTLPGSAEHGLVFPEAVRRRSALLDVAYEPWPSGLAAAWADVGGTVVSGLEMLLHQAIQQVRIFVTGREGGELPDEQRVVRAMRESVGL
ncbi:MAG TPA: shikimate dehydrogenase [Pseudolysinimonas sp.]|nr:shikimate dehydrogenase [Pseudolysinimonas sp.]